MGDVKILVTPSNIHRLMNNHNFTYRGKSWDTPQVALKDMQHGDGYFYTYVNEDEANKNNYTIVNNDSNLQIADYYNRIGQAHSLASRGSIQQIMNQYGLSEDKAIRLQTALRDFQDNFPFYYDWYHIRDINNDDLYNKLIADQHDILRLTGGDPAEANNYIQSLIKERDRSIQKSIESGRDEGLPPGYRVINKRVPGGYGDIYTSTPTVIYTGDMSDEQLENFRVQEAQTFNGFGSDDPRGFIVGQKKKEYKDPADNVLNELTAGIGGIARYGATKLVGDLINGGVKLGQRLTPSYWIPGEGFTGLAGTSTNGLGVTADYLFYGSNLANAAIDYKMDPSSSNATRLALSTLPFSQHTIVPMFKAAQGIGMAARYFPRVLGEYKSPIMQQFWKQPFQGTKTFAKIGGNMAKDVVNYGRKAASNNLEGWLRPYQDQVANGYQGWLDTQSAVNNGNTNFWNYLPNFHRSYSMQQRIPWRYAGSQEFTSAYGEPMVSYAFENLPLETIMYSDRATAFPRSNLNRLFTEGNVTDLMIDDINGPNIILQQSYPNTFEAHVAPGISSQFQKLLMNFRRSLPSNTYLGSHTKDFPTSGQLGLNMFNETGEAPSLFKLIDNSKMTLNPTQMEPYSPYSYSWVMRLGNRGGNQVRYGNSYMRAFNGETKPGDVPLELTKDILDMRSPYFRLQTVNDFLGRFPGSRKAFIGLDNELRIPAPQIYKGE